MCNLFALPQRLSPSPLIQIGAVLTPKFLCVRKARNKFSPYRIGVTVVKANEKLVRSTTVGRRCCRAIYKNVVFNFKIVGLCSIRKDLREISQVLFLLLVYLTHIVMCATSIPFTKYPVQSVFSYTVDTP